MVPFAAFEIDLRQVGDSRWFPRWMLLRALMWEANEQARIGLLKYPPRGLRKAR